MKALAVLGVGVALFAVVVIGFFNFGNTANQFEIAIKAQYKQNQNNYDNGWKEVMEKAQVPKMYTEQLKDLYKTAMTGRYGDSGSQALFQFLKEQNPSLDASLFRQIQQSIESFRKRFEAEQKSLIAKKQTYETYLYATYAGRFYNMIGGYPRIDLAAYDIVTSDKTQADFENKKAEPLNLNQ
jgi:hypothetical protein